MQALQSFWSDRSGAYFTIQRRQLSRADVEKEFGALLPNVVVGGRYHVFVSYR